MTEQPDTTAIRAGIFGNPAKVIYDLCDALDAARAERANWRKAAEDEAAWRRDWHRRAEAAEARIAELEQTIEGNWRQISKQGREILNLHAREEEDRIRMEGAEARIAAALATLSQHGGDGYDVDLAWHINRALTGDTT